MSMPAAGLRPQPPAAPVPAQGQGQSEERLPQVPTKQMGNIKLNGPGSSENVSSSGGKTKAQKEKKKHHFFGKK